jgi:sugar lactone lactonase YvrE
MLPSKYAGRVCRSAAALFVACLTVSAIGIPSVGRADTVSSPAGSWETLGTPVVVPGANETVTAYGCKYSVSSTVSAVRGLFLLSAPVTDGASWQASITNTGEDPYLGYQSVSGLFGGAGSPSAILTSLTYRGVSSPMTFSYSNSAGASGTIGGGIVAGTLPACMATSIDLNAPQGVAATTSGSVYVSDFNNDVIDRMTPAGDVSVFAGTGRFGAPTAGPAMSSNLDYPIGLAVSDTGNLYIADFGNSVVEKVTPSGTLSIVAGIPGSPGTPTPGRATKSRLDAPVGVAVDRSGNVYIADQGVEFGANNVIEKVTSSGQLSIFAGEIAASGSPTPGPATQSELGYPQAVAVDNGGNVYIADSLNNTIDKVNAAGNLSIYAGELGTGTGTPTPGPATDSRLNEPNGVATDGAGDVYVADSGNNTIEKIDTSGILSIVVGTGSAGYPTPGPATSSMLSFPVGVYLDGGDNLYIADTSNNVVEKVTPGGSLNVIAGNNGSIGGT